MDKHTSAKKMEYKSLIRCLVTIFLNGPTKFIHWMAEQKKVQTLLKKTMPVCIWERKKIHEKMENCTWHIIIYAESATKYSISI